MPRWRSFATDEPYVMHINLDRTSATTTTTKPVAMQTATQQEDEIVNVDASSMAKKFQNSDNSAANDDGDKRAKLDDGSIVVDGWQCIANDEGNAINCAHAPEFTLCLGRAAETASRRRLANSVGISFDTKQKLFQCVCSLSHSMNETFPVTVKLEDTADRKAATTAVEAVVKENVSDNRNDSNATSVMVKAELAPSSDKIVDTSFNVSTTTTTTKTAVAVADAVADATVDYNVVVNNAMNIDVNGVDQKPAFASSRTEAPNTHQQQQQQQPPPPSLPTQPAKRKRMSDTERLLADIAGLDGDKWRANDESKRAAVHTADGRSDGGKRRCRRASLGGDRSMSLAKTLLGNKQRRSPSTTSDGNAVTADESPSIFVKRTTRQAPRLAHDSDDDEAFNDNDVADDDESDDSDDSDNDDAAYGTSSNVPRPVLVIDGSQGSPNLNSQYVRSFHETHDSQPPSSSTSTTTTTAAATTTTATTLNVASTPIIDLSTTSSSTTTTAATTSHRSIQTALAREANDLQSEHRNLDGPAWQFDGNSDVCWRLFVNSSA